MSKRIASLVLLMIIVIGGNLGYVNWGMMKHRERMNNIEHQSYGRDMQLRNGLQHLNHDWSSRVTAFRMPSVVAVLTEYTHVNPITRKPVQGYAAGMVIGDGLILTAAHVVSNVQAKGAHEIKRMYIRFFDGTVRDVLKVAHPYGDCPDVGLIWFDSGGLDLHPVTTSEWDQEVVQGEPVLLMGTPKKNEHSVSSGIVSCVNRLDMGPYDFIDSYIQIDAPGNQGNSGGPAFDRDGNFIGMFVWLFVQHDGLCFLVPADRVLEGILSCEDPIELPVGVSG